MGSKALLLLKAPSLPSYHHGGRRLFSVPEVLGRRNGTRRCSTTNGAKPSLQPPDVSRLAETARISLTQQEVEEFAPKIRQMADWFGQLQAVDLSGVEPAIRADTEGGVAREDIPETFENKDPMIAAVPSYDEPYIKVPKVLNKE